MKKRSMMLATLLLTVSVAVAQLNPMTPIPVDKDVRIGKLENGMTYYIRHNEKPKGQADFYILHDVGAIQESDAQQGLAHFLEHMAFNGTKNLPGKMLIEYLETVGVKFGANLNASTGFDQTNYLLKDVPTSREGIIDTAMLILHDWSHFITIDSKEVDSERGVISEELRTRDGAGWRSMIKMLQAVGKGSQYEHRNIIGHLDGLKSFEHQALVDFYHQWYRPDYQAVVIVGDIDVDKTEQKIKALMSDIPAPAADASKKQAILVPDNEAPIVSVYTDPEMQGSKIQLYIKGKALPREVKNTISGEMLEIVHTYMSIMQNARLSELSMKPDAPFLGAGMHIGEDVLGIIPSLSIAAFVAATQDGKLATGFEAIYTEMEKTRRYGFTQGEFERAQENLMRQLERSYANRDDLRNNQFVQRYLSNFSSNSPIPDAKTEWQLDSMLVKTINVDLINKYAQQVITPTNQVIILNGPSKEGIETPTEEQLLAIRTKVADGEVKAYEDNVVKEPLISEGTVLKGSPVVKTTQDAKLGTTIWTLKNGVKIIVKPTTFKADEVALSGVAQGGLSLLTDAQYQLGGLISSVSSLSGVGKFSAAELRKQLSGKSASAGINVSEYATGLSGQCSPKDVETMFQLLYLNFAQPRFDRNDYDRLITMARAQLANARTNPDYIAEEKLLELIYNNNPRRKQLSLEMVDDFKFEELPALYAKLFSGINSYTFTIVGNVDLTTLKPMVEKYLGSLPVAKKPMSFVDDNVHPVKGAVSGNSTTPMQQPKVSVTFFFSGDMPYTLKDKAALTFLTQTLSNCYLTSIREEKGGTYGVSVSGSTAFIPKQTYEVTISFDTNEQMADELCEIVMKEIRDIAEQGTKSETTEKIREYMLKNWKNSLDQNDSWMHYIQSEDLYKLDYIGQYEQVLRSLTDADIQAMAKKILADGNLVKSILRPTKEEAK